MNIFIQVITLVNSHTQLNSSQAGDHLVGLLKQRTMLRKSPASFSSLRLLLSACAPCMMGHLRTGYKTLL